MRDSEGLYCPRCKGSFKEYAKFSDYCAEFVNGRITHSLSLTCKCCGYTVTSNLSTYEEAVKELENAWRPKL